jgi:transaldolase/glucose-6-phosphate isomerase
MAAKNPLLEVKKLGQSIWLDSIRRGQILSGELGRLIDEDGLAGETANPTIFEKAITGSTDYDGAVARLGGEGKSAAEIYEAIAIEDIRLAADVFRPVYDRTKAADGYVSIEVSPKLAHDTAGTVSEVKRFWSELRRPNVMIKIPGTEEGVPAIEECLSRGINVNITLLFAVEAYEKVAWAYIRALEKRAAAGREVDRVASVASFFVSRIDTLADTLIQEKIRAAAGGQEHDRLGRLLGKVAIANAKVAYQTFRKIFSDARFGELKAKGAMVQRPLWASTSTKNPDYSDVLYVESLIGPDTVNTLPLDTIRAFRDHGRASRAVESGVDEARSNLEELEASGLSLKEITGKLLDEGVEKFDASLEKLLAALETKRRNTGTSAIRRQSVSLGRYADEVKSVLTDVDHKSLAERIWKKDAGLWKTDPKHQAIIRNALGWLTVISAMQEQAGSLQAFAEDVRQAGFRNAVLCGMGGSSLCVEVFAETFAPAPDHPRLHVLDTTDPLTILSLEATLDLSKTLFVISSKSGKTVETLSHYRYFREKIKKIRGDRFGESFAAITDPGTPLDELALRDRFRGVFRNPRDIGGRYSALSCFGLVPAAVMGVHVEELLDRAEAMAHACASCVRTEENPGTWLGVTLGLLAGRGRDKITFVTSPGIETFGLWAEQLLAESTGKEGKGLIPVDGEPLGGPESYADDRVFVFLRLDNAANETLDRRLEALEKAGQPVVRLGLRDPYDIGAEFFRWEFAVAAAGSILGIDPYDQPNVQESKDNTERVLGGGAGRETPAFDGEKYAVFSTVEIGSNKDMESILSAFFRVIRPGDYLGLMAYLPQTGDNEEALQNIRLAVRDELRIATTLGYGPRFLHSTGQLHKGGPDRFVGLQITAEDDKDAPIPEESYSFAQLKRAQALGDWRSLGHHRRRALGVHLKRGAGLADLADAVWRSLGRDRQAVEKNERLRSREVK